MVPSGSESEATLQRVLEELAKLRQGADQGIKKLEKQVQQVQETADRLEAQLQRTAGAADNAAVPDLAKRAMRALAARARESIKEAGLPAEVLEEDEPTERHVASAYNLVERHQHCSTCTKRLKGPPVVASRLLRDLLVLKVCLGQGPLEEAKLKDKLRKAFVPEEVDGKKMSQLMLSFKTIVSCGSSRPAFTHKATIFEEFTGDEKEDLFQSFGICAKNASVNASAQRKKSNFVAPAQQKEEPKPKHCTCQEQASPAEGQREEVGRGTSSGVPVSSDPAAAQPYYDSVNLSSGATVDRREALDQGQPAYVVKVENTFITYKLEDSSPKRPSSAKRSRDTPEGSPDVPAPRHPDVSELRDLVIMCHECGQPAPRGWEEINKAYWCIPCWQGRIYKAMKEVPSDCTFFPGGPVIWYEKEARPADLPPCGATLPEVRVLEQCCMEVARTSARSKASVCLLVMGNERGPLVLHDRKGQSDTVWKSSTLHQAARLALKYMPPDQRFQPVPRDGGIYLHDVSLLEEGVRCKPPCAVSMIYATSSRVLTKQDEASERAEGQPSCIAFREDMEAKVLSVLSICIKHEHDEVILGAWGCGSRRAPPRIMAEVFHSVLFGERGVGHAFKRVTFCIQKSKEALDAFAEVFKQYVG